MKVYDIHLNDTTEGVQQISFVEKPAIEVDFIALNKQFSIIKKPNVLLNTDKRIVTTPVLIPDKQIFRNDAERGDHYIQFSKEVIEQISQKYFRDGNIFKFNLEHSQEVNGIYLCESYLVNKDRDINPPREFESLPDGTWIASFKIDNTKMWDAIKLGQFKGVSIEGYFNYDDDTDKTKLEEIKEIFKQLTKIK